MFDPGFEQLDQDALNERLVQAVFHWVYYSQAVSRFGKSVDITYQRELSSLIRYGMMMRHLSLEIFISRSKCSEENKSIFFSKEDVVSEKVRIIANGHVSAINSVDFPLVGVPEDRIALYIVFDKSRMATLHPMELDSVRFLDLLAV